MWLGHDEKRTANAYEAFDPEYLVDCMRATESVITQLQAQTRRPLFSCKLPATSHLRVLKAGRGGDKMQCFQGVDGGRDRDRTCDPYDVNVVLSR